LGGRCSGTDPDAQHQRRQLDEVIDPSVEQ
jgi:hypothetical protein